MGIKAYGLNLGFFGLDIEHLMWDHPSYMLLPGSGERKKVWYSTPTNAYVVEHPEGRILFEAGVSTGWRTEWPPGYGELAGWDEIKPEEFLEEKLKSVGLGPEDFRYVVAGHMHIDHAGGIRLFENTDAEVIIHEDEYRFIMSLEDGGWAYSRADYEMLPRMRPWVVHGDPEILPGVQLLSLPGHSKGLMGMLVHTEGSGSILFASDAIYHHEAYGPPPVGTGVTIQPERWAESVEKVYRIATKHEALVVPGHSVTGIRQHADGSTEFEEVRFGPDNAYV
ncbi:MAG: N-acyl homoserine lactone hydrolase [Solirubrobacteraceae bacterium]|jgi:glyoxylase-like metal-dependent hydrolase (beta-lactamase superfamily II)|nr:N-acyl homoserine lactone hydrolase [Solirubrobacteraceae bacterium]MEA2279248.1 N-acyl homoserine lactone hydrolase [Solirubrobacteraceae bacterium]MEA2357029.1 N-acyl homoserine lactone hydrolase [Solirubrobacteraceae bacterium]